jgi:hypothetical protein
VEKLGSTLCARSADILIETEDAAERLWIEAIEVIEQRIHSSFDDRDALVKAIKSLRKARVPNTANVGEPAKSTIDRFSSACEAVDSASSRYAEAYDNAVAGISRAIHEIAADERFREAVIWQNAGAFRTAISELLKNGPNAANDSKRRQHEELVANYWQRYCTKNDTIGFFGPVGWARLVEDGKILGVQPGPRLLASRRVYFELWCIDALAEVLAADDEVRPWLRPKRSPTAHLEGTTLHVPMKNPIRLSEQESRLFEACDGRLSAIQIRNALAGGPDSPFEDERAIDEALQSLEERKLVSRVPLIAPGTRPEEFLLKEIDLIENDAAREKAVRLFAELDAARRAIAEAASDPQKLDDSFRELEHSFERITGIGGTRLEGRTYAGRTLVFEDCRRDLEVEIGPKLLDSIAPALCLILAGARWFTFEVAKQYRTAFNNLYQKLSDGRANGPIDAADFWASAQQVLYGAAGDPSLRCQEDLRRRWLEILRIDQATRSISYSANELRPRVEEAFPAPGPGWRYARYHSPDLLIAAPNVEAVKRGDYRVVLGELHTAANTLGWAFFLEQHPSSQDFFKAIDVDLPEPRLIPMPPKYWPGRTSRCQNVLVSEKDICLQVADTTPGLMDRRTLPISEFIIEKCDDDLLISSRSGKLKFDLLDALSEALMSQVVNSFGMASDDSHTPRVSIDRLVISRETWRFSAAELEFAFEKEDSQRFLGATRWARRTGLPRFVFFKAAGEVKPSYCDFHSPIYVRMMAKAIRRAAGLSPDQSITVTEMLPGPGEVWLPDREGNLYTSELRLVAVDLRRC